MLDMEHVDGEYILQAKWGSCCLSYMAKSINYTSHYFPYSDHSKGSSSQRSKNTSGEDSM